MRVSSQMTHCRRDAQSGVRCDEDWTHTPGHVTVVVTGRDDVQSSMVEAPSGRQPVTWGELSEKQPAVTEDWEAMEAWRDQQGIRIH